MLPNHERRLREAHPEVRHVFLDPTDSPDEGDPRPGTDRLDGEDAYGGNDSSR